MSNIQAISQLNCFIILVSYETRSTFISVQTPMCKPEQFSLTKHGMIKMYSLIHRKHLKVPSQSTTFESAITCHCMMIFWQSMNNQNDNMSVCQYDSMVC